MVNGFSKHVGMDFGASRIKAIFTNSDGQYRFRSADYGIVGSMLCELGHAGIKTIVPTGIRQPSCASGRWNGFYVDVWAGDIIEREIELQVVGVLRLMRAHHLELKKFILVSIGTGTSYTYVDQETGRHFPLGNGIGGGTIRGLASTWGVDSFPKIAKLSETGKPVDILIKDVSKKLAKTPRGDFVLSYFGNATPNTPKKDLIASLLSMVAGSIALDIRRNDMTEFVKDLSSVDDVVFIGGALKGLPVFRKILFALCNGFVGKCPHFLESGEYSGALGAYLTKEAAR